MGNEKDNGRQKRVERNEPCTAFFNEVPEIKSNAHDYVKNQHNGNSMNPTQHVMLNDQSRELAQETTISVQEDKLKKRRDKYADEKGTIKHQNLLKKLRRVYNENDSAKHQEMLKIRRNKYAEQKGSENHQEILQRLRQEYAEQIGSDEHQEILQIRRHEYAEQIESDEHQEILQRRRHDYAEQIGSDEHQEILQRRRHEYVEQIGSDEQQEILQRRRLEYAEQIGSDEHQEILQRRRDEYAKQVGSDGHQEILTKLREKYASKIGTPEHDINLRLRRENAYSVRRQTNEAQKRIERFKKLVMEGPYYICVVCNRCLYRRSVVVFKEQSYENVNHEVFASRVESFDGCEYICKTCSLKLKSKKQQVPCQATCNKLKVFKLPQRLSVVNRLERVLVAKRILFKKVIIMPKGNAPKVKGAICNVPTEAEIICDTLPRPAHSNGLLLLKLKRKLMYRGNVHFEPARPQLISDLLHYLKENNQFYSNVAIDVNQISNELLQFDYETDTSISNDSNVVETDETSQNYRLEETEEDENPLDVHRTASNETIMMSKFPIDIDDKHTVSVAPGEGRRPLSIFEDENCEEMTFPHLHPTGKFGYKVKRDIPML